MELRFVECVHPLKPKMKLIYSEESLKLVFPEKTFEESVEHLEGVVRKVSCRDYLSRRDVSECDALSTTRDALGQILIDNARRVTLLTVKSVENWDFEFPVTEEALSGLPDVNANEIINAVYVEVLGNEHPKFRGL